MTYLLDFDRTLFDTDSFVTYLGNHEATADLRDLKGIDRVVELGKRIESGELTFAAGELSSYLYPDARTFLLEKGNSAMIITYGIPALQQAKVKSALQGIPRIAVMCTNLVRKGIFLAPYIDMYASPVFVDDSPEELEIMAEHCPNVQLFQMCREGREADGRWPAITSLAQLP